MGAVVEFIMARTIAVGKDTIVFQGIEHDSVVGGRRRLGRTHLYRSDL